MWDCIALLFEISDISLFLGAQSRVGQTNWFWENGTKVNDERYPPSEESVCEQMSVPLTYDDGINLMPKRCDQDEAYFACEVECKAILYFQYIAYSYGFIF